MRANIWSLISGLLLSAFLLTVGCSSPESEKVVQSVEETVSEPVSTVEDSAAGVAVPDPVTNEDGTVTYTVVIKQMQFFPQELTLNQGDKVIWVNEGIVAHNVTEKDNAWASPEIGVGESWESVPEGSYDYFCSIHPTMTGTIRVK